MLLLFAKLITMCAYVHAFSAIGNYRYNSKVFYMSRNQSFVVVIFIYYLWIRVRFISCPQMKIKIYSKIYFPLRFFRNGYCRLVKSSDFAVPPLSKKRLYRYKMIMFLLSGCTFKFCFNIQVILSGKDVILQAQTGSGKTLSYGVPILSSIDPNRAAIQAVIIVPTREVS